MIWEATISFVRIDEKGRDKNVKASYLIENLETFGDVEDYLYQEFGTQTCFEVCAIKISKLKEIANKRTNADERVFIATLEDTFVNDEGIEKEIKYTIAFFSKDMTSAHAYIESYISQGYGMRVVQIKESKFVDAIE